MDVTWDPSGDSLGDLILLLGDKVPYLDLIMECTRKEACHVKSLIFLCEGSDGGETTC